MEKKGNLLKYMKIGFWAMIALFIIGILVSLTQWTVVGYVIEGLFYASVVFVFVTSVISLAPQGKSMSVLALVLSGIFVVMILLMVLSLVLSGTAIK